MKKIIFGTAVALMAMLSACESLEQQDTPAGNERVRLTASIGSDTKTYLEQVDNRTFKTRWDEDDEFIVIDRSVDLTAVTDWEPYLGWFELVSGAGESTAEFELYEGSLPSSYVAFYGDIEPEETTGQWMTYISRNQYREIYSLADGREIQGFDSWEYPMYAAGSGSDISFKNLASVLKLNITGNGETLQAVQISALDDNVYLSGDARLHLNASNPTIELINEDIGSWDIDVYNYINFNPNDDYDCTLSDNPIECYIVLPAQTYPSGLKITVITDRGMMETTTASNLRFAASELREVPRLEFEATTSYEGTWRLESDEDLLPALFTDEENGYLVLKNHYIDRSAYLTFYDPDSNQYGMSSSYGNYTYQITNTCAQLQPDGDYLKIRHEGYYDIYLDPHACQVYMMSAGVPLSSLPTLENVASNWYYQIYEMADQSLVKAYGRVLAVNRTGFIMALDGHSDPILVYLNGSDANQQNALLNLEIGTYVELYATKVTYATLPELKNVVWSKVHDESDYYGDNVGSENITSYFDSYSSSYYGMISYIGVLEVSGSYYNVKVDGAETRIGSIASPLQDLSMYNGKQVYVEGFYAGLVNDKYVQTILTKIALPDVGGSTEDVIPDEDIQIR